MPAACGGVIQQGMIVPCSVVVQVMVLMTIGFCLQLCRGRKERRGRRKRENPGKLEKKKEEKKQG